MTQLTIETGDVRITVAPQSTSISVVNAFDRGDLAEYSRDAARRLVNAVAATPQPRFTKLDASGRELSAGATGKHSAVIDTTTGLMWSVESLGDETDADSGVAHDHAVQRCKDLRLLGFEDWRLPTRAELAGLIDDTRHEPAIDTDAFPGVKPRWHWTSTPCAWSSASAWYVYFHYAASTAATAAATGSRWPCVVPVSNWPL